MNNIIATKPRPRRSLSYTMIWCAKRFHSGKIRWSDWPRGSMRRVLQSLSQRPVAPPIAAIATSQGPSTAGCAMLQFRCGQGEQLSQDLERLRKIASENIRYERQLSRVRNAGKQTSCISDAVNKSLDNIVSKKARSFVIYGEPQSGKTEMMICLTAKLIDSGFNVVVHLLNDSVLNSCNKILNGFKGRACPPPLEIFPR